MPLVRISLRKGFTAAEKKGISNAIHESLVAIFKIPDSDRTHIIHELSENEFEIPPGKSDQYAVIELTVFGGRQKETKAALFGDIVSRLEKIGIPKTDSLIILNEQPLDNWGIRGGHQASQTNLGFKVDV
jgi:phenylpyruvate tautomerase PptA (4-oxalocrotonate tautomerase family)